MDYTLKIEAFELLNHPAGAQKLLLRSSFPVNSSVKYDYDTLIKGIYLLYPTKKLAINITLFVS